MALTKMIKPCSLCSILVSPYCGAGGMGGEERERGREERGREGEREREREKGEGGGEIVI